MAGHRAVGEQALLVVQRREACMPTLGFHHLPSACRAAHEQPDAEASARTEHADGALPRRLVGPVQNDALVRCQYRHRARDGAEIIEQAQPVQAE